MVDLKPCPFCGGVAKTDACMDPSLVRCVSDTRPHCPASFGGVSVETWNRRSSIAAEKAEEPDAPGIAEAPDGTLPCVYCSNENLCVEIRDDKHPGMLGFSVRCGSAFCGARGPVRPAQMDAVEEWNRAYRWVHPPKAEEPAPSPQAQGEVCECGHPWSEHVDGDDAERHARRYGWTCVEDGCECAAIPSKPLPAPAESAKPEKPALDLAIDAVFSALIRMGYSYEAANDMRNAIYHAHRDVCAAKAPAQDGEPPTVKECLRVAHEAIKAKHPHTAALAAELTEDERECVMAVRALCLAGRAPSSGATWRVEVRGSQPQCWVVVDPSGDCGEQSFTVGPCLDADEREDAEHFARMTRVALERMSIRLPSPALAAIVEAGDAMRNYFDETTLTMNRVKDKDAPGLMWALTEEYVSGATPILTDWDRARAALPKDGA